MRLQVFAALCLATLASLVPLTAAGRLVKYAWQVGYIEAAFDGVLRKVVGINGRSARDNAIIVDVGDTIEVWVENRMDVPTSIHWHGIRQERSQEMDGAAGVTQCAIAPGRSALYRFVASNAGTFWFHDHHGTKYVDGLRGPLIVREKPEHQQRCEKDVHEDVTIEISDWYHEQSDVLLQQMMADPSGNEPVWNSVIVNNRGRFDCNDVTEGLPCTNDQPLARVCFTPGKTYRLRLINVAAFAAFDVSIDGHFFQVIAADGVPVQLSAPINSIFINVGQRIDILVTAKPMAPGGPQQEQQQRPLHKRFWLRATSKTGAPWTSLPREQFPRGFNPHGLAIIDYDCQTQSSDPMSSPWTETKTIGEFDFAPLAPVALPKKPDQRIVVKFTMTSTETDPVVRGYLAIEDRELTTFEMPVWPTLFAVASGATVASLPPSTNAAAMAFGKHIELVLVNLDRGQHPFHLHSHHVWVVASGTAPLEAIVAKSPEPLRLENPMERDVYTVPSCEGGDESGECTEVGYVVLRLNADNPGAWMLHCHIDWHLATGLAMVFVEGEDELQRRGLHQFARSMLQTCDGAHKTLRA